MSRRLMFAMVSWALVMPVVGRADSGSVSESAPSASAAAAHSNRAYQNYLRAKQLIVDGYPEDRVRAENLLLDAVRLDPYQPEAFAELSRFTLWQIANSLLDPTAIYKASELATHVKEIASDRPLGDYLVCEILLAAGQYQQALKLYSETHTKYPNHLDSLVFEARFWSDIEPTRALASAQQALAMGYPMDDLSPAIAEAILKASEKGQAGSNIAKFANLYPDRWLWHRAALAYSEEGDFANARVAYTKAVELGNTFESRLQLAVLEYTELKDPASAVVQLQTLRKLLISRGDASPESVALVTAHLATASFDAGARASADLLAADALAVGERSPAVVNALISEFQKRGAEERLREPLIRLSEANPFADYVQITLGNMAVKRKDHSAAVNHFSIALLLSPDRDDLLSARAHSYYAMLDYGAALNDFESAIRLHPDSASHHYNRACMLTLLGRKNEAVAALGEAIHLNQELKELALQDTDLSALRGDSVYISELSKLGVLQNNQ